MKLFLMGLVALLAGCVSSGNVRPQRDLDHLNNAVVALVMSAPPPVTDDSTIFDIMEERDSRRDEDTADPQQIYCTGTFIASDLVLTAAHCVDDPEHEGNPLPRVKVGLFNTYESNPYFRNREWHYFRVVAFDDDHDLALLKASGAVGEFHTVMAIARVTPEQGDSVLLLGHPRGLGWTLTDGLVSYPKRQGGSAEDGLDPAGDHNSYVQVSAPGYFGNSGGPAINSQNELIGVTSNGGPWHIIMAVHLRQVKSFVYSSR